MRGYALDLEALAATARETGARVAWVCDPNNPTATTLSASEWESFLDALPDGCVAVVDEAYGDFLPPESRLSRERDVTEGRPVILLRSFSKLYGLAGLRLGYAIADPTVVRCLAVVDEPFNVNCAALAAGGASLRAVEAAAGAGARSPRLAATSPTGYETRAPSRCRPRSASSSRASTSTTWPSRTHSPSGACSSGRARTWAFRDTSGSRSARYP